MIASQERAGVRLLTLATAVPPHVMTQNEAADYAHGLYGGRMSGYQALSRVFASTGIDRRYITEPLEWFAEQRSFGERSESYVRGANEMFARVVGDALERASLDASAVDTVVFVSSTGIATPTIEARMLPELGFRSDVARVPVFGLGCAGGVTGLAIASRLAASRPESIVLLVALELCSLAFRPDRPTKKDLVSTALFGDGAACAILCYREAAGLATVGASAEHLWPNTLDIMGWSTDDVGLGVILSRSLPSFIAQGYREQYDRALARMDLDAESVARLVCHPGATRVLEAIESAMDYEPRTLADERAVMREYGNMSSPTVLFVLDRALNEGLHGRAVLAALGPGFTASFVQVDAGA